MIDLPSGVIEISSRLRKNGFKSYLVGGSVRDLIMGKKASDWDIATDAVPEKVISLFDKVVPTGIDFGTVSVMTGEGLVEVTTYRKDGRYIDGRRPEKVEFSKDILEDLSRRDFTMNAIALDPVTSEFVDPYDGRADIEKKIIRTVGSPLERFSEDGLRPMRACRFAATLGFEIEKDTLDAIGRTLDIFKKVSVERIHDELVKMLKADKPSVGFELMRRTGMLQIIMPELLAGLGVEQPKEYHKYDVYYHNIYACDRAPRDNINVRLAALLHDVAKPECKKDDTFYGHDGRGCETAESILRRLKFGNATIEAVCNLIKNHMFNYTDEWTAPAVRRFMKRVGVPNIGDLFSLRRADNAAMEREVDHAYLGQLQQRIDGVIAEDNALDVSDLEVDGDELMEALGISPGREVGSILGALLEKVLDDPSLNEKEKLIALARSLKKGAVG